MKHVYDKALALLWNRAEYENSITLVMDAMTFKEMASHHATYGVLDGNTSTFLGVPYRIMALPMLAEYSDEVIDFNQPVVEPRLLAIEYRTEAGLTTYLFDDITDARWKEGL